VLNEWNNLSLTNVIFAVLLIGMGQTEQMKMTKMPLTSESFSV
jgi:hypothetical protein